MEPPPLVPDALRVLLSTWIRSPNRVIWPPVAPCTRIFPELLILKGCSWVEPLSSSRATVPSFLTTSALLWLRLPPVISAGRGAENSPLAVISRLSSPPGCPRRIVWPCSVATRVTSPAAALSVPVLVMWLPNRRKLWPSGTAS